MPDSPFNDFLLGKRARSTMLRIIGLVTIFFLLAAKPEKLKQAIDIGSYVSKIVWLISEGTIKSLHHFYSREVAPEVEKAKSLDVTAP